MNIMNKQIRLAAFAGIALSTSAANAATITGSSTAPTIDGADIASLTGGYDVDNGDQGHLWSNRPSMGQSFTTGSNAGGYQLDAVTMRSRSGDSGSTYDVLIGTMSGTAFTQVGSTETTDSSNFGGYDYVTITLGTPLTLSANSTYGFLWKANGPGGFVIDNTAVNDSPYAGGEDDKSRVQAVCDWFGPSELLTMPPNMVANGRSEEQVA